MIVAATQAFKFLSTIFATAVLARILSPADFGLVQIATLFLGIITLFSSAGLELPVIQAKSLNLSQVNNLFWISCLVGLITGLTSALLAPVASWYFERPELTLIIVVSSCTFLCSAIGVQSRALMKRNLRFYELSKIEIAAMLLAQSLAIGCAFSTRSYWALVLIPVVSALVSSVCVCFLAPVTIQFPSRERGTGELLKIGANLTGFNVLNYFVRQLDNFVIADRFSDQDLGFYSKAYGLLLMPVSRINSPLSTIVVPALSRTRENNKRFRDVYVKCLFVLASLSIPTVVFLAVCSEEVILTVLGPKFADSIVLFQLLIPAAFVSSLNVSTGWVFASLGRTDKQLYSGLGAALVFIPLVILGGFYGVEGVACGVSAAFVLVRLPQMAYCFKGSPIGFKDFIDAVRTPWLACILAAGCTLLLKPVLGSSIPWLVLIFSSLVFGVSYISFALCFSDTRRIWFETYLKLRPSVG